MRTIQTSGFFPAFYIGAYRIEVYFFVISFVLSFLAYLLYKRSLKSLLTSQPFDPKHSLDFFIAAMAGGLIGARAFHVLWEEPLYYYESPIKVFDIIHGGFVWYGGVIGGLIATTLLYRHQKNKFRNFPQFLMWADFFAPLLALGYGLGRIACVLTGCCYGSVCYLFDLSFRYPTQGFAVFYELVIAGFLFYLERSQKNKIGFLFYCWIGLHGLGRLIMEVFRDDPRGELIDHLLSSISLTGPLSSSITHPFTISVASTISLILIFLSLWKLKSLKVG